MKYLKIAGLALVAVFVVSMAVAASASAQWLWLLCLERVSGKFMDAQCQNKTAGKFESEKLPVGKTDAVRIAVFSLRMRDKSAPGGESEIECNSSLTLDKVGGTLEGEEKGQVTEAEITESEVNKRCTRIKGACESGKIEALMGVNLPWNIKLEEIAGNTTEANTKIENSGKGEPGWLVKCKTILGSHTDICEYINKEYEVITLRNVVSAKVLLVAGKFLKARNVECSDSSGKRAGQLETPLIAILLAGGNGLSIKKS